MDGIELAMGMAVGFVVLGLLALLWAEAAGLSTAVVAGFGVVVLLGVGVLTAAVARIPEPSGGEHGT